MSAQFSVLSNNVPIRVEAALLTSSGDSAVKLAKPIAGLRSILVDDVGVPLVPGHWPMVDAVMASSVEVLSFERTLDARRDAFLSQHMLDGVPILPATFGCETLAEAAALLSPGFHIVQALDLEIDAPMKLFRNAPHALTVTARLIDVVSAQRVVTCESRSDFQRGGQVLQRDRLHHRGRFLLQPVGERRGRTVAVPDLGAFVRARSFFHMSKDPVALGPLFCRAEWLQISGEHVTGEVRPERQRSILSRSSAPRFQIDPLLMDAAFQIAANWDGVVNGYVSIPTGVGSLTLGRRRTPKEHARVWARVVRVEDPVVYYDIDVTGERNEVLMEIRRLTLHRVARLPAPPVIGKRA